MKRVRPIFIAHNPYRSQKAKLRNESADSQVSEPQILAALGFIAGLLFIGGMQLFRSIEADYSQIEPTLTPSLTFDLDNAPSIDPLKLNSLNNSRQTEILTIQNTISQGNF